MLCFGIYLRQHIINNVKCPYYSLVINTYMKNKLIVIFAVIVVTFGIVFLVRHQAAPSSNRATIKIGAALALTGNASSWGEVEQNGIKLAVSELNAKGGINGKKIEIVTEDTLSTSDGGLSAVQKLLSIDGVKYIIGPTWLDSYPGAQGAMKGSNAVMITPSASITAVQQGTPIPNVFSTWYRTDAIAAGLVQSIKDRGGTRVAMVFQNDAFYQEFISFFKADAAKQGITIVSEDLINPGQSDFKTVFSKINSEHVDGVAFAMYDEAMTDSFLRNHEQIASSTKLYSVDVVRGLFANDQYKKLLEGTTFVENAAPASDFAADYAKAYGTGPTLSASTAYDALNIVAQTIESETQDPVAYLKSTTFHTVSFGKVSFDSIGGIATQNKQYQVHTVSNGEIK